MKMKFNIFILLMIIILLSGCSLAKEEKELDDELYNFIGVKVLLDPENATSYNTFFVGFDTYIDSGFINQNIDNNENVITYPDGTTSTIFTKSKEHTMYLNRNYEKDILFYKVYIENGVIKEEVNDGIYFRSDVEVSFELTEEKKTYNETVLKKIKLNFLLVDDLKEIIIKEYDGNHEFIKEFSYFDRWNVRDYECQVNAAYLIITEVFIIDNEEVKVRTLMNVQEKMDSFLMKFTENGYVKGTRINFKKAGEGVL